MRKLYLIFYLCCLLSTITACSSGDVDSLKTLSSDDEVLLRSILQEEDSRPKSDVGIPKIMDGLDSDNSEIRRIAVRSLGRLERPDLVDEIGSVFRNDPSSSVRPEAANALAQAVIREESAGVQWILINSIAHEVDRGVRGVVAQSLGRLIYTTDEAIAPAEEAMMKAMENGSVGAIIGAVRGFESLTRRNRDHRLSDEASRRLRNLVYFGRSGQTTLQGDYAVVRRIAVKALTSAQAADIQVIQSALTDLDVEVRRSVIAAVAGLDNESSKLNFIKSGLKDNAATVRFEALRVYGSQLQESFGCVPIVEAVTDRNPHVSLYAIDLLGKGCPSTDPHVDIVDLLKSYCDQLGDGDDPNWHRPAHSLISLARLSPETARSYLARYTQHRIWQIRMYAARAATISESTDMLLGLTADPHPNVIQAALRGLNTVFGHQADGGLPAGIIPG